MQVLLRIANGKSNVRKVRIQSDTVIGRSPECQLKVASNQISRRHCQIVIRDTVVAIKDLGSANGTFVNGRQVPPEVEIPLTPGTRVMLGPLQFTVEYDLPGMSAIRNAAAMARESAVADDVGAISTSETEHQLQVETAQVGPSDGPLAPPGLLNVPPQLFPPAPTPVALAGFPPQSPLVAAAAPQVIGPGPVATQTANPAVASSKGIPQQPLVSPTAAPPILGSDHGIPVVTGNSGSHGFNFGIFAASGSGVIVESAREIPMISAEEPALTKPEPPKPAKKSLLQLFGWGKKKAAAAPEPHVLPQIVPPAEPPVVYEELSMEESASEDILTFNPPAEEAPAAPKDEGYQDEALKNIFNNFK